MTKTTLFLMNNPRTTSSPLNLITAPINPFITWLYLSLNNLSKQLCKNITKSYKSLYAMKSSKWLCKRVTKSSKSLCVRGITRPQSNFATTTEKHPPTLQPPAAMQRLINKQRLNPLIYNKLEIVKALFYYVKRLYHKIELPLYMAIGPVLKPIFANSIDKQLFRINLNNKISTDLYYFSVN